jgi:hypothetical protein
VTAKASIRSIGGLSKHRIYIEDVYPVVDGGRFPVKRIVGEEVDVWADIFRDGHVAAMGFGVLYLTPIHPIGRVNRGFISAISRSVHQPRAGKLIENLVTGEWHIIEWGGVRLRIDQQQDPALLFRCLT